MTEPKTEKSDESSQQRSGREKIFKKIQEALNSKTVEAMINSEQTEIVLTEEEWESKISENDSSS